MLDWFAKRILKKKKSARMSFSRVSQRLSKRFSSDPLGARPFLKTGLSKEVIAERYSISDAFRTYTWKTIPQMEEHLEENIIGDLASKMESETLKEELLLAYKRRRLKIESLNLEQEKQKQITDYSPDTAKIFYDIYFDDVNSTSEWRISRVSAHLILAVFKLKIIVRQLQFFEHEGFL